MTMPIRRKIAAAFTAAAFAVLAGCAATPPAPQLVRPAALPAVCGTDNPIKVGVVGDSVTLIGTGASDPSKSWVNLYIAQLSTACGGTPVQRYDATEGRDACCYVLQTVTTVPSGMDIVLFGDGINNEHETDSTGAYVYTAQDSYIAYSDDVMYRIRAANPTARIDCMGIWDLQTPREQEFDYLYQAGCHHYGGVFTQVSGMWGYTPYRSPNPYDSTLFHPNDTGYAAIAYRMEYFDGIAPS